MPVNVDNKFKKLSPVRREEEDEGEGGGVVRR